MRGVDVSRAFYDRKVAPLLAGISHAAGRIGRGSDVVGLDDRMSQDHDWGARVTVIADCATPDLPAGVELDTLEGFARSHLGLIPTDDIDWLLLTGQSVLEVTAGPVFRDDTGSLSALRAKLAWYPPAVEAYVVASSWMRIDQELPFIGRTGDRGDILGSQIITARVARAVMHLTFLLERRWPPYAKWYGDAYGSRPHRLDSEASICAALDELAGQPITVPFHDRPYRCVDPRFMAPAFGSPAADRDRLGRDVVRQRRRSLQARAAHRPARRIRILATLNPPPVRTARSTLGVSPAVREGVPGFG